MKLLFLGPPGAGKGTQASRVAERLGLAHVSTGEMFRAMDRTTELGRRVRDIMKAGDYVPDQITIEMLRHRIAEPDADAGFILDGFPRTIGQAEALDAELGSEGLDSVVVLEVPPEELMRRMLARGRADDTEETIANRLDVYRAQTEPLIGFYAERDLVKNVSGVGDVSAIADRIVEAVNG